MQSTNKVGMKVNESNYTQSDFVQHNSSKIQS